MGDLVDLTEYRNKKEEEEIARLRAELQEIVGSIGGLHIIPSMIMYDTSYPPVSYTYDSSYNYDSAFLTSYMKPEELNLSNKEDE